LLFTLGIFDHHGFCYASEVRKGGTYSSNGNSLLLGNVLRRDSSDFKFFHGDSAFSNLENYNTCLNNNTSFVMALKENVWRPLLKGSLKWRKTKLQFFETSDCETSETAYYV
jgi:hypothetical protein